jgi:deoxyadenosine/deoxycytidine kinase
MIVAVEGTIGAGKSTLLSKLSQELADRGIENSLLTEPVESWQSFGTSGVNLLKEMYFKPKQNSFYFQLVALITKLEQIKEPNKELILMERTIEAQLRVFLPLLKENGSVTELEYEICSRFMMHLSAMENNKPSLLVYLRVEPGMAKERIELRGRVEEADVSMTYLESIHKKYEQWLGGDTEVLVVESSEAFDIENLAKKIIDRLKI